MNTGALFCSAMFLLAGAGAAYADCAPLHLLNSVAMESVAGGSRLLVPVTINGTEEKLILDTGGGTTALSPVVVKALELRTVASHSIMFDAYGHGSALQAEVKSFGLGAAKGADFRLQVSAMPDFDHGAAGLISTDLFKDYDIDLDFGGGRLNYFSADHCDGGEVYWREQPLLVVPFTLEDGHINLRVTVDGHQLKAILDTGAPFTLMTATFADREFGLTPESPDMVEIGSPENFPQINYYSHKFASLSVGGLNVESPDIIVMKDRMGAGPAMRRSSIRGVVGDPYNRVNLDRLVIGMNILKRLHVYIAYGERRLYISPAGSGDVGLLDIAAIGTPPPLQQALAHPGCCARPRSGPLRQ
jgi:predicted aspartyl protease